MTTPPPPYSGPVATPPPPDRATLKAQRRAVAQQARLQREQMRLRTRTARRSSIVGPLLLLALGIVFLELQNGRWSWGGTLLWLGHWWPVILILAGLVLLLEYLWDRRFPQSLNGLPVRHTVGGGAATMLLLLALLGIGISLAHTGSTWAEQNWGKNIQFGDLGDLGDLPEMLGGNTYNSTLQAPLVAGGTLLVDDPRGDVTVTGSSPDDQIHVSVQQHVLGWFGGQGKHQGSAEAPRITGDARHATLTVDAASSSTVNLTIQLPHDAGLTVHSAHGDLSVEELRGPVDLHAGNGSVKLTALRGPVHVATTDDDADVTAHSLDGGLTVEGRTGDITLSDLEGPLVLQGDFFGTTHLEAIHGTVHFKSSFTSFDCAGLPGAVNIEGRDDMDGQRIEGPVVLLTSDRNITLDAVHGGAQIHDRNGSIHLSLAGRPAPIEIENQNGSVELAAPPNSSFNVAASTSNGEIQNQFGLHSSQQGEGVVLAGKVHAGGPLFQVKTTEGDVDLRQGAAGSSQDWDPKTPHHIALHPESSPAQGDD